MPPQLVSLLQAEGSAADRPLTDVVAGWECAQLFDEIEALEEFRANAPNLYQRVRAHAFLRRLYRFVLPRVGATDIGKGTGVPEAGWRALLARDFERALAAFRERWRACPGGLALGSALASAHGASALQALADQVRSSVRARPENRWMFEHADATTHPFALRPELLAPAALRLRERTPVRMDLSHSGWSDIFFLAMDLPRGARVLNLSIDLALRGQERRPEPPVRASLRVLDEPVLRLCSVDLGATVELERVAEVFDFARDHLGLLRAAVLAAGTVPVGLEHVDAPLAPLLASLVGAGRGLELESSVLGIPKGSRLAVSTTLLAALIAVQMRATGQTAALEGPLRDEERRQVAGRAILGEWLGGSGGGWQDSGGLWPGAKILSGVEAREGDPEWGQSKGRLLPRCEVLDERGFSAATRDALAASLVLVHGGLAQNVGPVLEQVTEAYLLRDSGPWAARKRSIALFDDIRAALAAGNIRRLAALTDEHFHGPLIEIVPTATNDFTEHLIAAVRAEFGADFWGFWMLGGMAGGGMGFFFASAMREPGAEFLRRTMASLSESLGEGTPFGIQPVVYEFAINDVGTTATLEPARAGTPSTPPPLVEDRPDERALEALLAASGFDREAHEETRARLLAGELGLHANRLGRTSVVSDVTPEALLASPSDEDVARGAEALAAGRAAVVTLAGGTASRWSGGAGVVKALYPFARIAGRHRTFLEAHLAKTKATKERFGATPPHVLTTSFRTHAALAAHVRTSDELFLSPGRWIGLRFVPTERDLLALWEDRAEQALDERAEKVRQSLRRAWLGWARTAGEGADYRDNAPMQCVHPLGHGLEVPSLLVNGTLARLLEQRPQLETLLLHNVDTLGANLDPGLLGLHLGRGAALTVEVTQRLLGDSGGSLALVDGRARLVESLALRDEAQELDLRFYNTLTSWIDIDGLLASFGLARAELRDAAGVRAAARAWVRRLPTYVTIKEVQRRWGRGQADLFPVLQVEKLWGDATSFPELAARFVAVDRRRGGQLKQLAELEDWRRDGGLEWFEERARF